MIGTVEGKTNCSLGTWEWVRSPWPIY